MIEGEGWQLLWGKGLTATSHPTPSPGAGSVLLADGDKEEESRERSEGPLSSRGFLAERSDPCI